jgi:hypothetical protein
VNADPTNAQPAAISKAVVNFMGRSLVFAAAQYERRRSVLITQHVPMTSYEMRCR